MTALFDTSIFVARERGDLELLTLPESTAVSVLTLAELRVGLHRARTDAQRTARMEALIELELMFTTLNVDGFVARQYALFAADGLSQGRMPQAMDGLIAATAVVHGLTLITRDSGFQQFSGLDVQIV